MRNKPLLNFRSLIQNRSFRVGQITLLLLVLLGVELVHRGVSGKGRVHNVAKKLYFIYKASQSAAKPQTRIDQTLTQATVAVTVDPNADRHPISPYIYGMAFAPKDYLKDLRLGSNRWGGNDKSRYNWVHGNASNAARDWKWANRAANGSMPEAPSIAADRFYADNHAAGAETMLTVPTIGWVALDTDNAHASREVPSKGGAPVSTAEGAITGYDPTENRRRTSIRSAARKKAPFTEHPTLVDDVVYQDEWIHHLVQTFGNASQGGVRFYAMDNEPDLWDYTHTDVHPARMGYDDLLSNFLEYATAVKAVDPAAEVTGPVASGWTAYLYSALDRGDDNFHTHADCTRHGGEAFLLWFLKQVRANDARSGKRTLDVLDVHYYPQGQGIYGGGVDPDTRERRLRATRSLWDANYVDESWIGEPVRLIPRLKEWIAAGYPGTKIGITEWNFGGDQDISGALAIAEALGIYGREGVYLANYWAYPPQGSPGYLAFRLFRNADGKGHGFGELSCRAVSANPEQVSCFAATDASGKALTILLVNKMRKATVTTPIACKAWNANSRPLKMWLLSAQHANEVVSQTSPPLRNGVVTLTLPPYSVLLLRMPAK